MRTTSLQLLLGLSARAVAGAALLSLFLPAPLAFGQCDPAEIAKLVASDPAAFDRFGVDVAVSGDTAVVGAYNDSHPGASQAGSAYVFVHVGGVWVEQAKLIASDFEANDQFGISVALSGDTAVVGAWQDDDEGESSGSAYVFVRSGPPGSEVWTEQAKLTAADGANNNLFGISVALSGDTAVIGASFPIGLGMAYIFVRSGPPGSEVWTEQAKLTDVGEPSTNGFGYSVAVSGDTAVIGAPEKNLLGSPSSGFVFKGAAFVFVRSGLPGSEVWTQRAMLTASDATQADRLGVSVSMSGDTIVAGAWQDDHEAGLDQGSAYVFVEPPGGWTTMTETAKLTASDAAPSDFFGISVALTDDTVLVGAHADDHAGGSESGSAYTFVKPPGGWIDMTETAKLTASDAALNDQFGISVALSGDTALVGAHFEGSVSAVQTGSAYVFEMSTVSHQAYCTAGTSASGCQAGMGAAGLASTTASSGFDLLAGTVEGNKDALFFLGTNGRQASAWGNGTSYQCVVPPVKRCGTLPGTGTNGACDGSFSQDLNALWCPTCPKPGHNPGAGAVVQAQLWYRDPQSTSNQPTSLSDAIEFCVAP